MIGSSLRKDSTSLSSIHFRTLHMEDPWTLPSPSTSREVSIPTKTDMSFPTTMVAYQSYLDLLVYSSPSSLRIEEEDPYAFPA